MRFQSETSVFKFLRYSVDFSYLRSIQWHPVNTTTFGPWKIGRINVMVVIKGFFK